MADYLPQEKGNKANARRDPLALERQMRARILGGEKPLLDSLSREEIAASRSMLLKGEAEIVCHACRMFLVAKLSNLM